MNINPSFCFRCFLPGSLLLLTLTGCGYERPTGKWVLLDTNEINFSGVELVKNAIDPNYQVVCKEARNEIQKQLNQQLAKKISPLTLNTAEILEKTEMDNNNVSLKLIITQCKIDVDQSGGSFTYYMDLPIKIKVTQNEQVLLSYNIKTYEQVTTSTPGPEFEFTFAEPVARTLLMFNGKQLWQPD